MATSKFGAAFRAAREAGDKEFTFNGKKYNTKMAPDEQKSVGGKPKAGEYVPRDQYTRSGQKSFDTDVEPGESPMSKYRPRRINSVLERTPAEMDEMVKKGLDRQAADRTKNDMPETAYKRGGSVKPSKMGGVKTAKPSFGSASKRADGVATKGKTRGKFI